ncbi:fumarate/nitrate reduction transcriptional regulator Fnr [Simiduia litorea]|uniref:fumarate/nitrate reduction transcriptional regulator Fnr n=1 Tax=Simiduia litorea TaxID=1435348 RepID=UPI0036F3051B
MSSAQHATCPHNTAVSCGECRLSSICLPISVHIDDIEKIDSIVKRGRPLQKGDYLFRAGEVFSSVYAVRSGSIKSLTLSDTGEEQITGFFLPGEVMGLDGIGHSKHTNSAIALETSAVCEIPFSQMTELSLKLPTLQNHFFQLMSREITHEQQLVTLLSKNTAEERVASLLLSISSRHQRRQLSGTRFRLSMSRADIGSFLGLTVETVSRVFSRLQKLGVIEVDKKEIDVKDLNLLKASASSSH